MNATWNVLYPEVSLWSAQSQAGVEDVHEGQHDREMQRGLDGVNDAAGDVVRGDERRTLAEREGVPEAPRHGSSLLVSRGSAGEVRRIGGFDSGPVNDGMRRG